MKIFIGPYPGLRSKKERKVNIRIDRYDCWSMDSTLAMIILPMLKIIKKDKRGSPCNTENEPGMPKSVQIPEKFDGVHGDDKNIHKRWNWILDEMIWTFQQLNTDWEDQFHSGKIDLDFVVTPETKDLPEDKQHHMMVIGPKDTHKFDRKGYDRHAARIQRGLILFGKYFQALCT